MKTQDKEDFLGIRLLSKFGRGHATQDELEFLIKCRKDFPEVCKKLEEEVGHQVMESLNPSYVRPDHSQ